MALRCPSCGEAIPFSAEACPSCGADTRVVVLTGDRESPTSRDRGRRWLRASVALAAVAALGGLLWFLGSRSDLPPETLVLSEPAAPPAEASGVRGPLQVGQNRWLCPLGWPQAAFDPDHLLNPGKVFPQLRRCAELGRVVVHQNKIPFPDIPRF